MRRARRSILVVGVAAILVALMAGPAVAKTVSAEKYAKTLCGTLTDLGDSEQELVDAYTAPPVDDPVVFQADAAQAVESYLADLQAAEAKLKKVQPDIKGGKKVSRLFVAYLNDAEASVQEALDAFQAADPNGVAFQADVTTLEVALQTLSATLGDPFSEVTNQELLGAFDEEPSCDDIVTVF